MASGTAPGGSQVPRPVRLGNGLPVEPAAPDDQRQEQRVQREEDGGYDDVLPREAVVVVHDVLVQRRVGEPAEVVGRCAVDGVESHRCCYPVDQTEQQPDEDQPPYGEER